MSGTPSFHRVQRDTVHSTAPRWPAPAHFPGQRGAQPWEGGGVGSRSGGAASGQPSRLLEETTALHSTEQSPPWLQVQGVTSGVFLQDLWTPVSCPRAWSGGVGCGVRCGVWPELRVDVMFGLASPPAALLTAIRAVLGPSSPHAGSPR